MALEDAGGTSAVKSAAKNTAKSGLQAVKTGVKTGIRPLTATAAAVKAKVAPRSAEAKPPGAVPAPAARADSIDSSAAAPAAPADGFVAHSDVLAARIKEYRSNPDASTWDPLVMQLRAFAQQPQTARMSPTALLQANPGLTDIGTKFVDFSGGRIWNFTKVSECQHLLLQWQNVVPGAEEAVVVRGKRRIVRGAPQVAWRAELIHIPPNVQIKEARIVGTSQVTTVGKKVIRTDSPRSLVLIGSERSGNSYLHAFRVQSGTWNEITDVFAGVPPYVLQNLSGKATFSGNDLVLAIGGSTTTGSGAGTGTITSTSTGTDGSEKKSAPTTASNGYRIVLKLVGGKYTLEGGKNGEEGPLAVTAQFASALQQNRPDLAKAWLADPKLVSIPKYIGYFTKAAPALRIIPMANPGNGSSRFRLITSLKDDLIVDVGKTKTLSYAVKGIFIAPPDPLAAKILSNLQTHESDSNKADKDDEK